jgi:spore coat polysaccharide biosynthesis predicted glycosyltransferase SpsG
MGHLFRALNITEYLVKEKMPFIIFINNDKVTKSILDNKRIEYKTVDLFDFTSDWETSLIKKHNITVWINDRLDTDIRHAQNVSKNGVKLVTFDDKGTGADLADIHVAALLLNEKEKGHIKGKYVLSGIEYLVLNKGIDKLRRIRTHVEKLIVTMGGSDTYGVTVKIVSHLQQLDYPVTLVVGPSFNHKKQLFEIIDDRFLVKETIPSLIEEFYYYDLAITGGGITPFEANASGLPCIIIANESWEIDNARYLEKIGSSVFAGFHTDFILPVIEDSITIKNMSECGIKNITTNAVKRIFRII